MRPIDADFAKERIKKSDLTSREKIAFLLILEDVPILAPPPNDPLTLEELREMSRDWVWIKLLVPLYRMETGYYIKNTKFSDADEFYCGYPDIVMRALPYAGYGDVWLAYRRRPEEGTP